MMKLVIESKGIGKFSDKKINKNMFGFGKHMVTYCFAVWLSRLRQLEHNICQHNSKASILKDIY